MRDILKTPFSPSLYTPIIYVFILNLWEIQKGKKQFSQECKFFRRCCIYFGCVLHTRQSQHFSGSDRSQVAANVRSGEGRSHRSGNQEKKQKFIWAFGISHQQKVGSSLQRPPCCQSQTKFRITLSSLNHTYFTAVTSPL